MSYLRLSQTAGEQVLIRHQGVEVVLTVVRLRRGCVQLGFEAPPEVEIIRRELLDWGGWTGREAKP
jgi:carbon storage regulator CsrA